MQQFFEKSLATISLCSNIIGHETKQFGFSEHWIHLDPFVNRVAPNTPDTFGPDYFGNKNIDYD
jgi:hypothetical protein